MLIDPGYLEDGFSAAFFPGLNPLIFKGLTSRAP